MMEWNRTECEYLRNLANNKFNDVRESWIQQGLWALPHRVKWLLAQQQGARNNHHIADPTHVLSLRSYVAGFSEGNTSASRPWYRVMAQDPDQSEFPQMREWLDHYTRRTQACLGSSNFYHAVPQVYYDYGVFNTAGMFVDEIQGQLFFHNLVPGAYKVINNALGEAVILVREFTLTVKALVDMYAKKDAKGRKDWSNISSNIKKMYEDSNYTQLVDVCQIVRENEFYNPDEPGVLLNKRWISLTYELGNARNANSGNAVLGEGPILGEKGLETRFLARSASKRKPFIIPKSFSNGNYEYGEMGPTTDALGIIRSLNKKAIAQDQALEQMLKPALQGPASLRKSYVSTQSNTFVPLDAQSNTKQGLRPIFEINPAIASLFENIQDVRQLIDKIYYADFLLYLSRNPKTRTATETNAIMQEQQLVIGPNLQSLNWSLNVPLVEFVMDFVLDNDPFLAPPPDELQGQFLRTEFVSVFAQAQKAADLPTIERYIGMLTNIGQLDPSVFQKANLDKIADIYEDRLFLPPGINRPQDQVDAKRAQAQAMAQRQQMLNETVPALAGAAKDIGLGMSSERDVSQ